MLALSCCGHVNLYITNTVCIISSACINSERNLYQAENILESVKNTKIDEQL